MQSIIKVPAAPHDSKQVMSRLHDARQYILRHAVNAMHYVSQPCTMCTPCNVRSTKEISLCEYTRTIQYMLSASLHTFIYCILHFRLGSYRTLFYIIGIILYRCTAKLNSALLQNKRNPNIDCQSVSFIPFKMHNRT